MIFRNRTLARVGAGIVGLLAAGALAAPALADATDADLSVKGASSKIAVGVPGKAFRFDVHNAGPGVATDTKVTLDWSGLDDGLVKVDARQFQPGLCDVVNETAACEIGDGAAGETLPWLLGIERVGGLGDAGSVTVTVESSAADPDPTNNTAALPVEVVASGVDLMVWVADVRAIDAESHGPVPVVPGETAPLTWILANQGDVAAKGISLSISLPEHVTFVDDFPGCPPSAGKRTVTCEFAEAVLPPGKAIGTSEDMMVRVDEDAPGPVTLTGGLVKGTATDTVDPAILRAQGVTAAPKGLQVKQIDELDIDPGDNDANFVVFVGAERGTGGGDDGDGDGGSGGGDGDDDGLPVTGVQAGLIGGVGAGVVVVGAVLFLVARRRRVVLVTPGDETPAA